MKASDINKSFIDYYKTQGFYMLPRAPMLDPSIPMSFVMSAGLVQIESSLSNVSACLGNQFVLVQSCFRHFDLETVGKDNIHLSFFEMPGAFSFGPNNRAATIQNMWHLATSVLGIDKNRIWATYFKGGHILGNDIPEDTQTCDIWHGLGIPLNRVVGLETNNFWIQGSGIENLSSPRKCGPNTELFYDFGVEKACSTDCKPGCNCERFVEFSNSLFINSQLDEQTGILQPILEPFTETVIGTERVAMLLQGVYSVFDIDSFLPIRAIICAYIDKPYLPQKVQDISERVVADYIKALYFLTADGAPPPGKNGRERIIKLLIRGILANQSILGITTAEFLPSLLDCISANVVIGFDSDAVKKRVLAYFSMEGPRFMQTIGYGQQIFAQLLKENNGNGLSGAQIVHLEKFFGLHHQLTAMYLLEQGLSFPDDEYSVELKNWKKALLA